jgi:hypothetical protein
MPHGQHDVEVGAGTFPGSIHKHGSEGARGAIEGEVLKKLVDRHLEFGDPRGVARGATKLRQGRAYPRRGGVSFRARIHRYRPRPIFGWPKPRVRGDADATGADPAADDATCNDATSVDAAKAAPTPPRERDGMGEGTGGHGHSPCFLRT